MQKLIKSILSGLGVYLLVTCLPFTHSLPQAHAEIESAIPQGWESYLSRPDILSVPAQARPVNANWEKLKAAHFSFVAELLEMYPKDTHLYFLARDSEHLYDVARLVTEGTPDASRVHLINVSRGNMRDPNLKAYLTENGISDEALEAGKKVLFVDTGFSGTISRIIGENFSEGSRAKLKTHLVVCSNFVHPSSRAFLMHLNPLVNEQHPSTMHGTIVSYEHMPRYTERSSTFLRSQGRYHPLSPVGGATEGLVSKTESLKYMADLKAYWQKPEVRERFSSERSLMKRAKQAVIDGSIASVENLKDQLSKSKDTAADRFFESFLRDAIEVESTTSLRIKRLRSELNLKSLGGNSSSQIQNSKKNELIKKYPEWAKVLENPDDEIPKLFENNDYQMIGNLIDANVDQEINALLVTSLYNQPATGIKKEYQILMIEKAEPTTLHHLAQFTFSQPHTKEMKDLIKLLIEKGDEYTFTTLLEYTFSQPHTSQMKDLIKLLIAKGNPETLRRMGSMTFNYPHTSDMKDLIKLLIEKGDPQTLQNLAKSSFSQHHTSEKKDLIKLLIEKGDPQTLQNLAQFTFSMPHTSEMKDLIKLLIEKGDPQTLQNLAQFTFSMPHTSEMKDLIKLLIEKGDPQTLQNLAQFTFSQHHTSEMKDLIKLLIEKGDPQTLQNLINRSFLNPHLEMREHYVIKQALSIQDPAQRRAWLNRELLKMGSALGVSQRRKLVPLSSSPAKPISPKLSPGDVVEVRSQRLEVVRPAGEGRRGIVFEVKSAKGARYALKVAKNADADTLKSIAEETAKALKWQKLKIPHSKVLVQEKTYVLKTWIEGLSGDKVVEKLAQGDQTLLPAKKALLRLVREIQGRGGYVGDFRPPNLIWTGKAWIMIDSGSVQDGKTIEDALKKWSESDERGPKFERRWKMPVPQGLQCIDLFSAA